MEIAIAIVGVLLVVMFIMLGARRYTCPQCKEPVRKGATVCPHCGYRVPEG